MFGTRNDPRPSRAAQRNYSVLLGQGISNSAANELTSVQLVLPFLYTAAGGPVFFAGLLVPASTVAKRAAQLLAAPLVSAARSDKRWMACAALAVAAAIVLISFTITVASVYWLVPIFLFAALVIGGTNGLGSLAFQDLIGRILSRERRNRLLFTQSSLAGLLVVIIAVGSQLIFRPGTSGTAHQELIWLGIGLFLLAALLIMAIQEPAKRAPRDDSVARETRGSEIVKLRDNFRAAFALPWFGRFLIARTLYLSIELAIPFYSIHAASFHDNSIGGLSAFVIAANIGLIAGGFLWERLGKHSVDRVLILAAGITAVGGLMATAIELRLISQSILCYAIVFVLVSLGAQGIKNGRTLYLLDKTTDEERPYCLAVANVTIGVMAVVLGAFLGILASYKGVAWPIFVLVVLNVLATLYTLKLRDR